MGQGGVKVFTLIPARKSPENRDLFLTKIQLVGNANQLNFYVARRDSNAIIGIHIEEPTERNDTMQYLSLALKGIAIGAANVMPGVSGATLAVIFRVYDRLLESINSLFTDTKKSLQFLIPFGLGMVIGIIALGTAIDFFITRFSLQSAAFIAGLMAGSISFIHGQATSKMDGDGKKPLYYGIAVACAAIIIILAFFVPTPEPYIGVNFNIWFALYLFVGGLVAAAAMIIPGVSGAMVLILFGLYALAMHTISLIREYLMTPLDFGLLPPILMVCIPIGLGVVAGILLASRLISTLLDKYHTATYFAIIGLIFGTIFAIFGDSQTYQSHDGITFVLIMYAAVAFVVGMVVSLLLGKK